LYAHFNKLEQNERQQLTDCKGSNDQVGGKSSAEATNGQMSASELENGNENDDNGEANTPNPQVCPLICGLIELI
jgi:hypothetical protein